MTSAELCRRNEWVVGTFIESESDGYYDLIMITAIGEDLVLAREMVTNARECLYDLTLREWKNAASL